MSQPADRCDETLIFTNILSGQNVEITCTRVNSNPTDLVNLNPPLANCTSAPGSGTGQGEGLILVNPYPYGSLSPTYGGVKVNIYEGTYTFGGPGRFIFGMVDPNLDKNVVNVGGGNSQNVAFALLDTLSIGNYTGPNNTPLVSNPPIDNVCYRQQFCYNPGMVDADHDSLAYSLIQFTTGDTSGGFYNASGSFIPQGIRVDQYGNLCWTSQPGNFSDQQAPNPSAPDEYDIDVLITEYRANPSGGPRYKIGSMIFAVQLLVVNCPPTTLSLVASPVNECVEAGNSLQPPIVATATASANGPLSISASGMALTANNIGTNASFPSNSGFPSVSSTLHWTPSCQAVSLSPYYFTIQANDNASASGTGSGLNNSTYTTVAVQVVSPAVQNLTATVAGNNVQLTWTPPLNCSSSASNTDNPITEYIIYRINNCISYSPTICKTGVPASSGFQVIGTCTASPYFDTNNGQGLPPGNSYSYIVVAKFADGSLSMAPAFTGSMCVTLHFGVPIITNVSVNNTDPSLGSIFIKWQNPLADAINFDTTKIGNKGPYHFTVQREDAAGTYTNTIYSSTPKTYFGQLTSLSDITYVDTLIDTQTKSYKYKIYFYADTNVNKGSSAPASSVFATGVGHDKKAVLSWTSQTPWRDTLYYIFKKHYTDNGFTLIDSTHQTTYTVTGLTNGYNYCFKIQSVGTYENPNIISPLYNFSQKVCVMPIDDSPPCQPTLTIVGDCDASINKLTWVNPDHICNINDVLKYYIYYTPRQDSALTKIDSVLNVNDTTYTTNVNTQNIAGCYVIVAVDSAGNQSPLNNETCTDNCPEYELPNIFTPNSDNVNDLYVPVKNRYIQSVDFTLYNRWGEVVYENTNPALGWDGKSKQMKQPVPDGTYFYTCTVYERHFYGIKEIKLKGFVQLIK
ncbi:MAG TPA: gliding motility-associated C-terminal domain-containing protein [Bacteroidia bacterium]|nr:gliding motility-associated C-terminal domain-containing protein [Bacteroidia bacterium]